MISFQECIWQRYATQFKDFFFGVSVKKLHELLLQENLFKSPHSRNYSVHSNNLENSYDNGKLFQF